MMLSLPPRLRGLVARSALVTVISSLPSVQAWAVPDSPETAHAISLSESYAQKGETAAAIIELKNALRRDPQSTTARFQLAALYMRSGDYPSAINELEALRAKNYDLQQLTPLLAESYFAVGDFRRVVSRLEIGALSGADRAAVLALRGRAHIALKDLENARSSIAQALAAYPNHLGARLASASLSAAEGDVPKAEAEVDEALKLDPKHDDLLVLKGQLRHDQRDEKGAMKAYDNVVARSPHHRGALLGRALTNLMFDHQEATLRDITLVLSSDPSNPLANYLRAYLLKRDQKFPEAIAILHSNPRLLEQYPGALYLLASSAYLSNRMDLALTYAEKYAEQRPLDLNGAKLLASTQMRSGMTAKAATVLEPLAAQQPDDAQIKIMLANAYLALGRSSDAVSLLQEGVALDPGNVPARLSLAVGELKLGATDAGIMQLQTAVQSQPTSVEANVALALAHINARQPEKARAAAAAFLKAEPSNPHAYNLQGTAALAARNGPAARAAFLGALKQDAKFVPAMLNLGGVDEMEGKPAAAIAWYQKAITADPTAMRAYEKLASLEFADNQTEQGIKTLEKAIARDPAAVSVRLRLIDALAQRKAYGAALIAARAFVTAFPGNRIAMDALAQTQLLMGNFTNAIGTYERLASQHPGDFEIHRRLGRAFMSAAQDDKGGGAVYWKQARSALDKALELMPDSLTVLNDRLELEFRAVNVGAALDLAAGLSSARPDSAERLLALGGVQLANGQQGDAVESYRRAWQKKENDLTGRRLLDALNRASKTEEALAFIEAWCTKRPKDSNLRILLMSQYIAMARTNDATREALLLNQQLPNHPVILNNLAWLYGEKDKVKAIAYGEQAFALTPHSADVLDTLGSLYVEKGEVKKGGALLAQAYEGAPSQPGIAYRYAAALQKGGDSGKAIAVLQKLLANERSFQERSQAQSLLEKIKR